MLLIQSSYSIHVKNNDLRVFWIEKQMQQERLFVNIKEKKQIKHVFIRVIKRNDQVVSMKMVVSLILVQNVHIFGVYGDNQNLLHAPNNIVIVESMYIP